MMGGDYNPRLDVKNILYDERVTIPFVDFCVGMPCTLKCKLCSQWNPYLKNKSWRKIDYLKADLELLLSKIDYVWGVNLVGGEPLAYKDLDTILELCIESNKIGFVSITTNGTIYPKDEVLELLKNKKVLTTVSSYKCIKNDVFNKLTAFLQINNCHCNIGRDQKFYDLGMPKKKEGKIETAELEDKFWKCWLRDCTLYYEGKLYRCVRTYSSINIGLLAEEDVYGEWIDIKSVIDKDNMKLALKKFYSIDYLKTCGICNEVGKRMIYDAAEQVSEKK